MNQLCAMPVSRANESILSCSAISFDSRSKGEIIPVGFALVGSSRSENLCPLLGPTGLRGFGQIGTHSGKKNAKTETTSCSLTKGPRLLGSRASVWGRWSQRLFLKLEGFHGKRDLDILTWTGGSNKLDKEHKLWSQKDLSSHAESFTFCCVAICKPCDLLKLQYLVGKMGLEMLLL